MDYLTLAAITGATYNLLVRGVRGTVKWHLDKNLWGRGGGRGRLRPTVLSLPPNFQAKRFSRLPPLHSAPTIASIMQS